MPWALTLTKLMVLDKDLDIRGLYVLNKSNKGIRCALTSSLTVWSEWPVGTPASCSFPHGQSTSHSAWSLSDCISHFSEWSSSLGQLPRSHLLKENVKEHETRVGVRERRKYICVKSAINSWMSWILQPWEESSITLILQLRRVNIERESSAGTLWRIKLEMVLNCGAK